MDLQKNLAREAARLVRPFCPAASCPPLVRQGDQCCHHPTVREPRDPLLHLRSQGAFQNPLGPPAPQSSLTSRDSAVFCAARPPCRYTRDGGLPHLYRTELLARHFLKRLSKVPPSFHGTGHLAALDLIIIPDSVTTWPQNGSNTARVRDVYTR